MTSETPDELYRYAFNQTMHLLAAMMVGINDCSSRGECESATSSIQACLDVLNRQLKDMEE